MKYIIKILVLLRLRKITSKDVSKWTVDRNTEMLLFCLDHGSFKQKLSVLKSLRSIGNKSVIDKLLYIARSELGELSDEAILTIESLDRNEEFETRIDRIKQNNFHFLTYKRTYNTKPINRKERMQRLEIVRKQLSKRIRF